MMTCNVNIMFFSSFDYCFLYRFPYFVLKRQDISWKQLPYMYTNGFPYLILIRLPTYPCGFPTYKIYFWDRSYWFYCMYKINSKNYLFVSFFIYQNTIFLSIFYLYAFLLLCFALLLLYQCCNITFSSLCIFIIIFVL